MHALLAAALGIALLGFTAPVAADVPSRMPANRDRIAAVLIQRGAVARNATPQQLDAAVDAYLQSKAGAEKRGNRIARKQLDANESALDAMTTGAVRGRKLGTTATVTGSSPQLKPLEGTGKLLVILVDFASTPFTWTRADGKPYTAAGPLHNQIKAPSNTYDLWRPDFNTQHYEDMLFTPGGWTVPWGKYAGERRPSMRDYYLAQSYGRYTVDGNAYGWFTVAKPEAYYGDDDASGNDLLPGTTWDLIRDAVAVANAQKAIPWGDYDTDGDCVLDHVLFIHAGADQSAGGGAQGDDAIWAHSWDVRPAVRVGSSKKCRDLYLSNYTIMPEDGSIGVFAHEFGHDLGLPDEYDVAYSGRGESVANWSLMSQASWTGAPAQTEPGNMSIWARYALGWLAPGDNLGVVDFSSLGKDPVGFRLEQSSFWGGANTLNALKINIPPSRTTFTTPHSGAMLYWGGKADLLDGTLRRSVDLTGKSSASLTFWTWYDMEQGWDFGFVQVSTDGSTWTSLPIAGTTADHDPAAMPEIVANLPGFTGRSGGWVQKTADLSAYAGKTIQLQFRSMTDWGTSNPGFFVDDIAVTANGATLFADGAEAANPAWTAQGWTRTNGSMETRRYYMVEWRNTSRFTVSSNGAPIANPDAGLNRCTQYDPYGSTGNELDPWLYPYSPGLVLWLRDFAYGDNITRNHLGHGFLAVVDAHDNPIMRPSAGSTAPGVGSYPFNTHVQISDASFSLDRAVDFTLGYWGIAKQYSGLAAIPGFDDSLTYWNTQTPDASTVVPSLGLVFRVAGQASDDSAAVISIGRK